MLGAWGACAPATWNRHVATARSFVAFCQRRDWLPDEVGLRVDGREPADRTRAIPYVQLERLWSREDVAVREKTLWRLLYETAARASEILSLNVEDVDRDNRRAVVRSKGGDIDLLHFQTGSARLIPRLIAERARGPLFLTDRRPRWAEHPRSWTCARSPAVRGCPTAAPRTCSAKPQAAGAASAVPLGDHASGRGQRRPADVDGQEPPHEPALATEVRPAERGRGRRVHRRARPRTPASLST